MAKHTHYRAFTQLLFSGSISGRGYVRPNILKDALNLKQKNLLLIFLLQKIAYFMEKASNMVVLVIQTKLPRQSGKHTVTGSNDPIALYPMYEESSSLLPSASNTRSSFGSLWPAKLLDTPVNCTNHHVNSMSIMGTFVPCPSIYSQPGILLCTFICGKLTGKYKNLNITKINGVPAYQK